MFEIWHPNDDKTAFIKKKVNSYIYKTKIGNMQVEVNVVPWFTQRDLSRPLFIKYLKEVVFGGNPVKIYQMVSPLMINEKEVKEDYDIARQTSCGIELSYSGKITKIYGKKSPIYGKKSPDES